MEERFCDGKLVEVALTPDEYRTVRVGSKRMRDTLLWLKAAIAHEDFDGSAALVAIERALHVPPAEQTREALT